MTFEVLLSADALVPDHDHAIVRAHRELGVPRPPEHHVVRSAEQRAVWSFPRVHPDRGLAPTNLEFLQTLASDPGTPIGPDYSFVPDIEAAQGDRPAKLHSTPVGVSDLDAVVERLERTGGRYRFHEATSALPFPRLWVGYNPDDGGRYDPGTDGGLWLELVPAHAHRLPADPGPPPARNDDGRLIRVVARTILVADMSATLHALDRNFGIEPESVTTGSDGIERAVIPFRNPRSATVEVLRPAPGASGFEANVFESWGPGPCSIRFAVDGLDAFGARQHELGLEITAAAPVGAAPRLLRPLDPVFGNAYEFVSWNGD